MLFVYHYDMKIENTSFNVQLNKLITINYDSSIIYKTVSDLSTIIPGLIDNAYIRYNTLISYLL